MTEKNNDLDKVDDAGDKQDAGLNKNLKSHPTADSDRDRAAGDKASNRPANHRDLS